MITELELPKQKNERIYPYLATFMHEEFIVYLISKDPNDEVVVTPFDGKNSYVTASEEDYTPLPSGSKLTLIQE